MKRSLLPGLILSLVFFASNCSDDATTTTTISGPTACATEVMTLSSPKVTTAPTLDSAGVAAFTGSEACVNVTANAVYTPQPATDTVGAAYPGLTTSFVSIKSVYTDSDVYFLAKWKDTTKNLERYPWEKQADGTWKQLTNKDSSGHENTYYEDKFAMQWAMGTNGSSSAGFVASGCGTSCHLGTNDAPARKYNLDNQVTDMWHWKSVRTQIVGQLDDKHILADNADDTVDCVTTGGCRVGDDKASGGYNDNKGSKFTTTSLACVTSTVPCYMGPSGNTTLNTTTDWGTIVLDGTQQDFADTFATGDKIAGMTSTVWVGSRGDITTYASHDGTYWTLIMKRAKTTTTTTQDVQFDTGASGGSYYFGVGVFDNTQINHAVHSGKITLTFAQ